MKVIRFDDLIETPWRNGPLETEYPASAGIRGIYCLHG